MHSKRVSEIILDFKRMQQDSSKSSEVVAYISLFECIQESFDCLGNVEDSESDKIIREVIGWLEEFDASEHPEPYVSSTAHSSTIPLATSLRILSDETIIEPVVGAIASKGWESEFFDRSSSFHPSVRPHPRRKLCTAISVR